jgi:hypothetical protein
MFADNPEQGSGGINIEIDEFAVDGEGDHIVLLSCLGLVVGQGCHDGIDFTSSEGDALILENPFEAKLKTSREPHNLGNFSRRAWRASLDMYMCNQ